MNDIRKSAHTPRIGIWWLVGKSLVAFTEDLQEVATVRGTQDSDLAHLEKWPEVTRRYPRLKGTEYEFTPRGRVLKKGDTFHLLLPANFAKNQDFVGKVVAKFHLQSVQLQVIVDEHYNSPELVDWDD